MGFYLAVCFPASPSVLLDRDPGRWEEGNMIVQKAQDYSCGIVSGCKMSNHIVYSKSDEISVKEMSRSG